MKRATEQRGEERLQTFQKNVPQRSYQIFIGTKDTGEYRIRRFIYGANLSKVRTRAEDSYQIFKLLKPSKVSALCRALSRCMDQGSEKAETFQRLVPVKYEIQVIISSRL